VEWFASFAKEPVFITKTKSFFAQLLTVTFSRLIQLPTKTILMLMMLKKELPTGILRSILLSKPCLKMNVWKAHKSKIAFSEARSISLIAATPSN